jgi:hypothetical protein
MGRAWNIKFRLHVFFEDAEIDTFRAFQAQFGYVISGSFAVQFFASIEYEGSDLDIYAEYRYGYYLCVWLQQIGYQSSSPHGFQQDYLRQISRDYPNNQGDFVALGFVHPTRQKRIHVVVTNSE